MTWNARTRGRPDEIADRITRLALNGDDTKEHQQQLKAAKAAAKALVKSGAVGNSPLAVSLDGHANDRHKPDPRGVYGVVSVSVAQIPEELVDEFDAAQAAADAG